MTEEHITEEHITPAQTPNWLAVTTDTARSTWNILRSLGPLLVSQSDSASEAYARHRARLAAIDAGVELVRQEVASLSEINKDLRQRYFSSTDTVDRIRIKRDLEEIERDLRRLKVGASALVYIGEVPYEGESSPPALGVGSDPNPADVQDHWLDRFRDLAGQHNEPWREDLFARALAAESTSPGSVPPRTLFLLGTLEEHQFLVFAEALNIAVQIGDQLLVPKFDIFCDQAIPECSFDPTLTGEHFLYQLDDTGLLSDPFQSFNTISKGEQIIGSYADRTFLIDCRNNELKVDGVLLTPLGASLAQFCSRSTRALGKKIFDFWLKSLDTEKYPRQEVIQQRVAPDKADQG